jgi:hypothetical protein
MRFRSFAIALAVLPTLLALAQTPKPSTGPATRASLAQGEVRFTPPPDDWAELPQPDGSNGTIATYKHNDDHAVITVSTTEQKQPLPDTPRIRFSLGTQMVKAIRADIDNNKAEVLEAPKLERDERYLIRIRDKIRINGITSDRLHLHRAMGYQFVRVTARVDDQEPDAVKQAFTVAETLLDGATLGKRDRKPPVTRPAKR